MSVHTDLHIVQYIIYLHVLLVHQYCVWSIVDVLAVLAGLVCQIGPILLSYDQLRNCACVYRPNIQRSVCVCVCVCVHCLCARMLTICWVFLMCNG